MSKTLIIAEAGVNHNGSVEKAKQLIDAAAEAGADYVKFQTFKASKLVSAQAKKASYQQQTVNDGDDSQFAMIKKLELSEEMHVELLAYCKTKNIQFLSTGFDEDSIDYLDQIGIKLFKIPSGEITNKPYLQHIARKGKPVILSTGMATLAEIEAAMDVFLAEGLTKEKITVLHCNTEYPTPMEDVNLKAMLTIREKLGVNTGYSDHTLGIEVPIAAVALGATVIEKHFTLNRNLPGPDHKASLEPNELKAMVNAIRNVEKAMSGNGEKIPSASESKNIAIVRKSIHTQKTIAKDKTIRADDLIAIRPGDGISPILWDNVIGKKAARDLDANYKIKESDFYE